MQIKIEYEQTSKLQSGGPFMEKDMLVIEGSKLFIDLLVEVENMVRAVQNKKYGVADAYLSSAKEIIDNIVQQS
jgi:hypothetical protein